MGDSTGPHRSSAQGKGLSRRQILALTSIAAAGASIAVPTSASAITRSENLEHLEKSRPESVSAPTARAAGGWGGYSNGQIPASAMAGVPAAVGQPYLRTDAAGAYFALSDEFKKKFGSALPITEAYRDLARQNALWDAYQNGTGNLAAPPGTSVHGWALACDFGGGVASYNTPQKQWMDVNAPRFGWQPRGNTFTQQEPWHFEYDGTYNPGDGQENDGEDDVFKPRFVKIADSGAPNGMNGLVAFLFPDRAVRTKNEAEILSLGRAWGVLKPGQKWSDVVDSINYGEYVSAETEINNARSAMRAEYVKSIVEALK